MVSGPVQYKRQYTLWVLILLILICWPAAIVYYFTRDKVPVQELHTYTYAQPYPQAAPPPGGAPGGAARFCSRCGTQNAAGATFCSKCGAPLS